MSVPTMPEPFATVQTAIIAKLAAQGITCYDHQPIELYGVPSAYLMASDILPGWERSDQGEVMIGRLEYKLRYFVSLEDGEQVAHAVAYSGARKIMAAFAGGLLGGAVRAASINRMSLDPVQMGANNRAMLLVEADVSIDPSQYT